MPHLAPMSWLNMIFFFWFTIMLFLSVDWWLNHFIFDNLLESYTKSKNIIKWDWSL